MKRKKPPAADIHELMPILLSIWRRFHKLPGPPDRLQTREFRSVVDALLELLKRNQTNPFENPDLLGAYLLYQTVIHYQEGLSLLGELPEAPQRVLDLASGTLAFALAALKYGAEVVATDISAKALTLGSEMCGQMGFAVTTRVADALQNPFPEKGPYDLIIVGHALFELFQRDDEKMLKWSRSLLSQLTPQGFLLIVDDSHQEMNHRLLALRDRLGIPIQAPCIWKGPCPALQAHEPCFAQREMEKPFLIKELQLAAHINLSSLKMSYILFRNPASGWPDLPDGKFYRVISPALESFQGTRFYLCGTDGKKTLESSQPELGLDARAFQYLRRGEVVAVQRALEKPSGYVIVKETEVKVEAALGKPIPQERHEPNR